MSRNHLSVTPELASTRYSFCGCELRSRQATNSSCGCQQNTINFMFAHFLAKFFFFSESTLQSPLGVEWFFLIDLIRLGK